MKMIVRIVSDQRAAAAAAAKPGLSNQKRRTQPRQRIGVKKIEGRIRRRPFKIKRLIAQPENINAEKNVVIVRKNRYTKESNIPSRS